MTICINVAIIYELIIGLIFKYITKYKHTKMLILITKSEIFMYFKR